MNTDPESDMETRQAYFRNMNGDTYFRREY